MSTEKDKEGVITKYKIVAGLHALLGLGLLTCAIMGTLSAQEDDGYIGTPFFIGGYLVGIVNLFAAILATCVVVKGGDKDNSQVNGCHVGCAILGHLLIAMLTLMMCFIGLFMAGSFVSDTNDDDRIDSAMAKIRDRNRIIAYAIIAGCVASILMTIFVIYMTCTYSSVFNVKVSNHHSNRIVALNTVNTNTGITAPCTYPAQTNTSSQMEQLRTQNLLLQQQISLQQQQLFMQQQQGFSGGPNIPPPPSYSAVMADPSYPPPNHVVPSASDPFKSY